MNKTLSAWVVELKVASMTGATLGMGIVLAVLNDTQANSDLLWGPAPVQSLELAIIPTLINFVTGYITKHTPRPELNEDGQAGA
jgi:hypothetical protein